MSASTSRALEHLDRLPLYSHALTGKIATKFREFPLELDEIFKELDRFPFDSPTILLGLIGEIHLKRTFNDLNKNFKEATVTTYSETPPTLNGFSFERHRHRLIVREGTKKEKTVTDYDGVTTVAPKDGSRKFAIIWESKLYPPKIYFRKNRQGNAVSAAIHPERIERITLPLRRALEMPIAMIVVTYGENILPDGDQTKFVDQGGIIAAFPANDDLIWNRVHEYLAQKGKIRI